MQSIESHHRVRVVVLNRCRVPRKIRRYRFRKVPHVCVLVRSSKFEEYLDKYVRGKQAPKDPLTNRKSKKKLPKGGGAKIDDETNTNNSSMGDLQALILAKNKNRAAAADDLFARLEAKYAKPEKIKKANNDSGRVKGVKGGKVKKNKK